MLAVLTLTACDEDKGAPQPEDLCRLVERTAAVSQGDIVILLHANEWVTAHEQVNIPEGKRLIIKAPEDAPAHITLGTAGFKTAAGMDLQNVNIELANATTPLITLTTRPDTEFDGKYFRLGNIILRNVTVSGLRGSLINDGGTAFCIDTLTLERVNIRQPADSAERQRALIALQHSGVRAFNVNNSTVGGKTAVACAAQ
jgi:hypothetical protein